MPPLMSRDPEGYYARLGVDPSSGPEIITAAWRRRAREVHPDVPVTGDAEAFVELKRAYDVLISPDRRAAYDRLSFPRTQAGKTAEDFEPGEIGPVPFPDLATPPTRHPRLRDLPVAVWFGMAALLTVGVVEVGLHLNSLPAPMRNAGIPAKTPDAPPPVQNEAVSPAYGAAPVRLAGTPNFYIIPTASPAMLWRLDEAKKVLVPWGQLPPFSAVQGLRLLQANGLVEVKVTDTSNGFVEASRLSPGDSAAAARAWCTYNAGPTPANGEVLTQNGLGGANLAIENRSGQPAVVKLRAPDGVVFASVFLDPGGQTTLQRLTEGKAQLEFATGEAWSRACRGFAAGMRAVRLTNPVTIGKLTRVIIPVEPGIASLDLPDQAFERE